MRTKKRRQPRKPGPHSELGERIRAARLHVAGLRGEKLSQERLARELEVTPSAWSRLESGATKRPDRHAMYQLEELAGYEHGTILPELRRLSIQPLSSLTLVSPSLPKPAALAGKKLG